MKTSIRILLILAICFPFLSIRPAAAQTDGPFVPGACMFELPIGYTQDQYLQCGFLSVPEDHTNPSGDTIRLAVVILKSKAANPQPDPLFMAQGGPGGSTIDTYASRMLSDNPYPERDIVLFDQRGTLYSQPVLYCKEIDDLTIQTLDQNLSLAESERLNLEAMTACRQRLASQGINLSDFNSLQNAEDIESLRQALGYSKIDLYGVSYGTLLALHYMRLHPDSLRSVILDGVVPPQTNFILNSGQTENQSFTRLFDACKADPACNRQFPDLEKVLFDLVDQLNQQPARVTLTDPKTQKSYPDAVVNGDTFQWLIFQLLYAADIFPALPHMIYDARQGNFDVSGRILSILLFDHTMSYGMYYSVICAEDADFTPQEQNLSGVRPQIARLEKGSPQALLNTCKMWNVQPLGPQADEPVVSDVPTLLLSGAFDPITPSTYAEQAASNLKHSYSFVFPAGGHGQFLDNECSNGIMGAFLSNPNQAPDGACIQKYPAPVFYTNATIIQIPALLKMLNLDPASTVQFLLLILGWLFLLTGFVVFPVAWLVNRTRRKPAAAAGAYPSPADNPPALGFEPGSDLPASWQSPADPNWSAPVPAAQHAPSIWRRWSSWLAVLEATLLGIFLIALTVIVVQMVNGNDNRLFYGLAGEARPWFVIPLIFGLLGLDMLVTAVMLWARGEGSVLRRLYYSLLALTVLVCTLVMGTLGMLSGLF